MTWLPVVVTAGPATEPVTVAECRAQCGIGDATDFDGPIAIWSPAAREHAERYTGTKFVTQTVVLRGDSFAALGCLPCAPIASITSVKYLDPEGVEQTLSTDVYEAVLIGLEPSIRLKVNQSWPAIRSANDAVRVTAVAGYGAASDVPAPIKQAILLTVSTWFDNREAGDMPEAAMNLLTNFRVF